MNRRWLRRVLRIAGLILIVGAAVIFFRGGWSFRTETQTSGETYEIRHIVVLREGALIPGVAGVVLIAGSLFLRSKRA